MHKFNDYLIESTKLWLGFEHLPTAMNPELKRFITRLKKHADDDVIYIEPKYDFKKASTQLIIKVTDKQLIPKLAVNKDLVGYGFIKKGEKFVSSKLVNIALVPSGGMRGSGRLPKKGEKVANPSTAEQEAGTIAYFETAFKGKKLTLKQVSEKVGFDFSPEWMHNFEQQYIAFSKNFGNFPKHKIYLDSEKNDSNVLFNLAKRFGLKDLKDNWNPADIWIMSINKAQVIKQTKDVTSLHEFNAWLADKYESKEILGVSLKKISKNKTAKVETVSTSDIPDVDLKPMRVYLEGRQKGSDVQLGSVSAQLFPELASKNGFDLKADKTKILNDPMKYLNTTLPKLLKKSFVIDKVSPFPTSEVQLKAGAWLTYYLEILAESDPDILKSCYYSAIKKNDFSSIHCKVY